MSRGHAIPLPHAPGEVRLSPAKILWHGGIAVAGALAPFWFDWTAALFGAGSAIVLLGLGHSVGLHRGVIHRAFDMGVWTERVLLYLAILTGIGGPLSLLRMHDTRDHHQNRPEAPAYYAYDHSMVQDASWYLFHVHTGPGKAPPAAREADPFYRFLEATWRWQQLPWAVLLYDWGGLPWLLWGVGARLFACVYGHWFVNYAAHTSGYRRVTMPGSGEEGRNHLVWGALAMGEGWHNNHHAWPSSARFGVTWWEIDPGWWIVRALQALGLVWNVRTWADGAPLRAGATVHRVDTVRDAVRAWGRAAG
jgi:stearoyl-CoA desaturase (delta-9 desaturase)